MESIKLIKRAANPECAITFRDIGMIIWLYFKRYIWIPIRYAMS